MYHSIVYLQELVLFLHIGPGDQTQVVKFSGRSLYPLSSLSSTGPRILRLKSTMKITCSKSLVLHVEKQRLGNKSVDLSKVLHQL